MGPEFRTFSAIDKPGPVCLPSNAITAKDCRFFKNMFASGYEDLGSFFCDKKATLVIGLLFAMDLSAGDYAVANLCPDSKLQKSLVTSQT